MNAQLAKIPLLGNADALFQSLEAVVVQGKDVRIDAFCKLRMLQAHFLHTFCMHQLEACRAPGTNRWTFFCYDDKKKNAVTGEIAEVRLQYGRVELLVADSLTKSSTTTTTTYGKWFKQTHESGGGGASKHWSNLFVYDYTHKRLRSLDALYPAEARACMRTEDDAGMAEWVRTFALVAEYGHRGSNKHEPEAHLQVNHIGANKIDKYNCAQDSVVAMLLRKLVQLSENTLHTRISEQLISSTIVVTTTPTNQHPHELLQLAVAAAAASSFSSFSSSSSSSSSHPAAAATTAAAAASPPPLASSFAASSASSLTSRCPSLSMSASSVPAALTAQVPRVPSLPKPASSAPAAPTTRIPSVPTPGPASVPAPSAKIPSAPAASSTRVPFSSKPASSVPAASTARVPSVPPPFSSSAPSAKFPSAPAASSMPTSARVPLLPTASTSARIPPVPVAMATKQGSMLAPVAMPVVKKTSQPPTTSMFQARRIIPKKIVSAPEPSSIPFVSPPKPIAPLTSDYRQQQLLAAENRELANQLAAQKIKSAQMEYELQAHAQTQQRILVEMEALKQQQQQQQQQQQLAPGFTSLVLEPLATHTNHSYYFPPPPPPPEQQVLYQYTPPLQQQQQQQQHDFSSVAAAASHCFPPPPPPLPLPPLPPVSSSCYHPIQQQQHVETAHVMIAPQDQQQMSYQYTQPPQPSQQHIASSSQAASFKPRMPPPPPLAILFDSDGRTASTIAPGKAGKYWAPPDQFFFAQKGFFRWNKCLSSSVINQKFGRVFNGELLPEKDRIAVIQFAIDTLFARGVLQDNQDKVAWAVILTHDVMVQLNLDNQAFAVDSDPGRILEAGRRMISHSGGYGSWVWIGAARSARHPPPPPPPPHHSIAFDRSRSRSRSRSRDRYRDHDHNHNKDSAPSFDHRHRQQPSSSSSTKLLSHKMSVLVKQGICFDVQREDVDWGAVHNERTAPFRALVEGIGQAAEATDDYQARHRDGQHILSVIKSLNLLTGPILATLQSIYRHSGSSAVVELAFDTPDTIAALQQNCVRAKQHLPTLAVIPCTRHFSMQEESSK